MKQSPRDRSESTNSSLWCTVVISMRRSHRNSKDPALGQGRRGQMSYAKRYITSQLNSSDSLISEGPELNVLSFLPHCVDNYNERFGFLLLDTKLNFILIKYIPKNEACCLNLTFSVNNYGCSAFSTRRGGIHNSCNYRPWIESFGDFL